MTDDSPSNLGRPTFASVSGRQHLGLSVAAALIGVVTAVGVRLFNQAIAFIQSATGSLEAAGALTIPLTLALGGVLVAIFLHRFGQKTQLTSVPHIIDAVAMRFQPGSAFTLWLSTTSSVAQAQERPAPE